MTSAFQGTAFQTNTRAFQIDVVATLIRTPEAFGGLIDDAASYTHPTLALGFGRRIDGTTPIDAGEAIDAGHYDRNLITSAASQADLFATPAAAAELLSDAASYASPTLPLEFGRRIDGSFPIDAGHYFRNLITSAASQADLFATPAASTDLVSDATNHANPTLPLGFGRRVDGTTPIDGGAPIDAGHYDRNLITSSPTLDVEIDD
jgi:hypothetical protein